MYSSAKNSIDRSAGALSESSKDLSKRIIITFFPSSSAGGEMEKEDDDYSYKAKIFLLKTPVEDCSQTTKELIDPQHWALVIQFPSFYCKIDGGAHEGDLVGSYTKNFGKPEGKLYRLNEKDLLSAHDELESATVGVVKEGLFGLVKNSVTGFIAKGARSLLPEIDCVEMSPAQVYKVARDNALNNTKYMPGVNDCQSWAIEAATVIKNNYVNKK